jgi:hypothetical protein
MSPRAARVVLIVLSVWLAALVPAQAAQARILGTQEDAEPAQAVDMGDVSEWFNERFSKVEREALLPGDLSIESHECSCSDRPIPHFPYRVVIFGSPKGDLVTRADGREMSVSMTLLAVRHGDRYCEVGAEESCFGAFENPCEFTDHRYGPHLAPFFPSCKSDSAVDSSPGPRSEADPASKTN